MSGSCGDFVMVSPYPNPNANGVYPACPLGGIHGTGDVMIFRDGTRANLTLNNIGMVAKACNDENCPCFFINTGPLPGYSFRVFGQVRRGYEQMATKLDNPNERFQVIKAQKRDMRVTNPWVLPEYSETGEEIEGNKTWHPQMFWGKNGLQSNGKKSG